MQSENQTTLDSKHTVTVLGWVLRCGLLAIFAFAPVWLEYTRNRSAQVSA